MADLKPSLNPEIKFLGKHRSSWVVFVEVLCYAFYRNDALHHNSPQPIYCRKLITIPITCRPYRIKQYNS